MNRERDRLGRPVEPGSPDAMQGIEERTHIDSGTAWHEALDYLGRGMPFHAHETFELRWRCCPESERALWKALARWAAAATQAERGSAKGAASIARVTLLDLERADWAPIGRAGISEVLTSLALLRTADQPSAE